MESEDTLDSEEDGTCAESSDRLADEYALCPSASPNRLSSETLRSLSRQASLRLKLLRGNCPRLRGGVESGGTVSIVDPLT